MTGPRTAPSAGGLAAMLTMYNRMAGMSGTAAGEAQFLRLYKLKGGELAVRKRDMRGAWITVVPVQHEDTSAWYRCAPIAPSALPK